MKTTKLKSYRNIVILTSILKWLLVYGTALVLILIFISRKNPTTPNTENASKIKSLIIAIGISLLPLVTISIIVKDKIQPTLWMLNVILSNFLLGNIAMYIVFLLWMINEYILKPINNKFKLKYAIRKEINSGD